MKKMVHLTNVGQCVQLAQIIRGIPSAELARGMGVAPQQVHRWRIADNMRLHTVQDLAGFFSMEIEEFLDLDKQNA